VAIFSRRTIQQLINKLLPHIGERALKTHINILNSKSSGENKITQILSSEWELAVLAGLSELGKIKYEVSGSGTSKPDVLFNSSKDKIEFIADITTVSDNNSHKENPVDYFIQELCRIAEKYNVSTNRLTCQINGDEIYSDRGKVVKKYFHNGPKIHEVGIQAKDAKTELFLPEKGQIPNFIEKEIVPFYQKVQKQPERADEIVIQEHNVDIAIKYNPQQKSFVGHYPSYAVTNSIDRNPLYHRLTKKSEQLKDSGYKGIKGVIVCDGGCELLKKYFSHGTNHSSNDVVQYFFQEDNTVDFIVIISIDSPPSTPFAPRKLEINMSLNAKKRISTFFPALKSLFKEELLMYLPPVKRMPVNARNLFKSKRPHLYSSFIGGLRMNGNSIKISSRGLHTLLSGEINFDEFMKLHQDMKIGSKTNHFKLMAQTGKAIKSIHVEKCEDDDDDWLVFEFSQQDPAISKYKLKGEPEDLDN
jgi:hypothetical protein